MRFVRGCDDSLRIIDDRNTIATKGSESVNEKQLGFAVFCIENVAAHLDINGRDVYAKLVDSDILDEYIIANYEALHTQDKDYIVADIVEYMAEKGLLT